MNLNETVIAVLGGSLASRGEQMLAEAGCRVVSTPAYPSTEMLKELFAREQPTALIVRLIKGLDGGLMDAAPGLKLIAKHGAGVNDIDLAAAAKRDLPVIAAVGANAPSVAEHALMMMLALAKDLRHRDAALRLGVWDKADYRGFDLADRTLGLVGFGKIAQNLARMALGLNMRLLVYDPFAAPTENVEMTDDLEYLFAASDVISLHCPLLPQTEGLVSAARLARMKPGALLINTARGEIVDEDALLDALREGRIAGAGLDSFAHEPPRPDHPLWTLPNVVVTPHIAGVTLDARDAVSTMTAANVLHFLRGEALPPTVFAQTV